MKLLMTREAAWNLLTSTTYKKYRFRGCTNKRLIKIKSEIMQDDEFWSDILLRHNLTIDSLPSEHCIGNFYGMLHQSFLEKKWIR